MLSASKMLRMTSVLCAVRLVTCWGLRWMSFGALWLLWKFFFVHFPGGMNTATLKEEGWPINWLCVSLVCMRESEREREFARHIHWLSLLSELCWLLLTLTAWTSLTLPYTSFLWHFENLLWSKYPQTNALSSPLVLCLRGRTGVVLTQGLQGISIFRQSIKVI